jgi:putative effector of murein hydrolase
MAFHKRSATQRIVGIKVNSEVNLLLTICPIGLAAHGIGTARILAMNETGGASASFGMGLRGLATATLLPLAAHWLGTVGAR